MFRSNIESMSARDGQGGAKMNNIMEESYQEDKRALLMLSGGRDSFLSACLLIEEGYQVYMVTYDNGCISDIGSTKRNLSCAVRQPGGAVSVLGVCGLCVTGHVVAQVC